LSRTWVMFNLSRYYISFDCGTMGTKTAIYRDDSSLAAEAYRENVISYPQTGWAEMDPCGFVRAVREGVNECLQKSAINTREIRAISASGIICGITGIDENWNPVTPFVPYLDSRARAEANFVKNNIEPVWIEESGNVTVDEFLPPMILRWFINNYDGFKNVVKVVNNGPFVLGKLAGLKGDKAFLDWATLSGWLIGFDARKRNWSEKQLKALGIPDTILPKIVKPWDIVGYLCPEEAVKMGIPEGIPIVAGAGDTMQSALASGLFEPGQSTDVAGTASIFAVAVSGMLDRISHTPGMMFAMGTLEDSYFYWSMIRAGGLSLRWFRDNIADCAGESSFYAKMDALANEIPAGSNGLIFYPYLQGAGPDLPGACGAFMGLFGASNRAAMWRSMLEAIAFEYLQMVQIYRNNWIPLTEVIGTEGGSKSILWTQIKADVLGSTYNIPARSEGGLMADAAVAAYAVGDIPDIKTTMKEWVKFRRCIKPDSKTHDIYQTIFKSRQEILSSQMKDVFTGLENIRNKLTNSR